MKPLATKIFSLIHVLLDSLLLETVESELEVKLTEEQIHLPSVHSKVRMHYVL